MRNPLWLAGDVLRPDKWPFWPWFKRNPFANAGNVVVGVAHKHRTVISTASPYTFAPYGWNRGWTYVDRYWFALPFISWRGKRLEWCAGWMTSGAFALTFRRANSPNAAEKP